jgi:ornithine cyclodeaminase/alanine dehydrogenase-like protein (mu-crystallin family)
MGQAAGLVILDAVAVRERLTVGAAIPVVRAAMIALSTDRVRQLLRSFIAVGEGKTFAIMPAALLDTEVFGAKLVSVFADGQGRKAHEGVVVLFDGVGGLPVCVADAGEVTAIRTAAASAVATDALARPDAERLAILGTGRQAAAHIEAIVQIRALKSVSVWGRDFERTHAFAAEMAASSGLKVEAAPNVETAVASADIVCTVSTVVDPILHGAWVTPGTHINVVGSSGPMAAEIDGELVRASRFIVDHREHVLVHGGEFVRAKAEGLVDDNHIASEIGQVLAGAVEGRQSADQITVYKSLGHAAQDLAVAAWLYRNR